MIRSVRLQTIEEFFPSIQRCSNNLTNRNFIRNYFEKWLIILEDEYRKNDKHLLGSVSQMFFFVLKQQNLTSYVNCWVLNHTLSNTDVLGRIWWFRDDTQQSTIFHREVTFYFNAKLNILFPDKTTDWHFVNRRASIIKTISLLFFLLLVFSSLTTSRSVNVYFTVTAQLLRKLIMTHL